MHLIEPRQQNCKLSKQVGVQNIVLFTRERTLWEIEKLENDAWVLGAQELSFFCLKLKIEKK